MGPSPMADSLCFFFDELTMCRRCGGGLVSHGELVAAAALSCVVQPACTTLHSDLLLSLATVSYNYLASRTLDQLV
jgi:hypothetical protein